MPQRAKTGESETRVRALHCKSRLGCLTCKQRRVKCDEALPICLRCRKSGRECQKDTRPKPAQVRSCDFNVTLLIPSPRNPLVIDEDSALAIEFFLHKTLPILRQCRPSPLWNHMIQLLQSDGPVVRRIASAIGSQHRAVEGQDAPTSAEQSCVLYSKAIRAVRRSIAEYCEAELTTHALCCLLLVVLESLRRSSSEMLIHLNYSIRVFHQKCPGAEVSDLMRESARMLENYAMSSMVFDPFSESAFMARQLLRELWRCYPATDEVLLTEKALLSDLVEGIETMWTLSQAPTPIDLPSPERERQISDHWKQKQRAMEEVFQERMNTCKGDPVKSAHYGFLLARGIMTANFLRCFPSKYEKIHDSELETYQKIVDLEEAALAQLRCVDNTRPSDVPNCFSLGLGAISTLTFVAMKCRDFYLRRRALLVMKMCPRIEGLWTVNAAQLFCRTIIEFEERKAARFPGRASPTEIPEGCRVHHTIIFDKGNRKYLRLFWREDLQTMELIHEDVLLVPRPSPT